MTDLGTPLLLCPPLTIRLELPLEGGASIDESHFRALPAKPGVLAIEDETGGTLSLITTADLRRAALTRLGPVPKDQAKSPRTNLRGIARRVLATTVGSAFEADWAYLQLARARLPHSYRHMLDRWQAWFIHCDATQRFPQWVKTSHPGSPPTGRGGTYIGPFADKHVAHRFIELLEDAFDLCRYHHILVQAPRGTACAYKEMGRCPAPCDGSVSVPDYLRQVRDSIEFARSPVSARNRLQERMDQCSANLDFEGAQRCKTILDRTAAADQPKFANARDLIDFRFVAVLPCERAKWARLMMIDGGSIAPLADVRTEAAQHQLADILAARQTGAAGPADVTEADVENLGLVCRHLLMPRAQARRRRAEFLAFTDSLDTAALASAIAWVTRDVDAPDADDDDDDDVDVAAPAEQELEGA